MNAIDLKTTALVLIDLQQGIVTRPLTPRAGVEVVQNAIRIADLFRKRATTVVLVRVAFSADRGDAIKVDVDEMMQMPALLPPNWSELVPEVGPKPGDIVITKHQWGAFYGTELDLQLRRRGIGTIVLAGISTNFGVESTARAAHERAYRQIFVEDAMTSAMPGAHDFTVKNIFPRIGHVCSTVELLDSLSV